MAATFSQALVNTMLGKTLPAAYSPTAGDITDGASFKTIMSGCFIDIFGGVRPATPELIEGSTKLVRLYKLTEPAGTTGLSWEDTGDISTGILHKLSTETWQGVVTLAGVATWFRCYSNVAGDYAGGASANYCRFDGSVGTTTASNMVLTNTRLVLDEPCIVRAFYVELPTVGT